MSLTWELTLDDKNYTAGAKRASAATVQLRSDLKAARDMVANIETDFGKASVNITRMSDAMGAAFTGALVTGVKALTVAFVGLGAALWKFSETASEAFASRQGSIRAYTTLLGDAKQAEVEFYKAQKLSQMTDLTSAQTEKAQKSLMVAGFRGQNLDAALAATLDVSSMAAPEERGQTVERVARGLSQIFAKGKLQGEEINQLSEAGLSKKLITEQLLGTGQYGKDAAAVEKSISGGKVGADAGIAAIERAILKQFGTTKLGEYATGASGSISGLESNKGEAFQNLLKSFDSDLLPATKRYKDSLVDASEAMSLESQTGKDLKIVLQDLASTGMGLRAAWNDFQTGFLDTFAQSYVKALEDMGFTTDKSKAAMATMGDVARGLGEAFGTLGTATAYLVHTFEEGSKLLAEAWSDLKDVAKSPGKWLLGMDPEDTAIEGTSALADPRDDGTRRGDVYTETTEDGKTTVSHKATSDAFAGAETGEAAGEGYIEGFRKATKTHSPSEEMRNLGRDLSDGLAIGMGEGGRSASPTAAPAAGNVGPFYIEVHATDAANVETQLEDMLGRIFGRLNRAPV